MQVARIAAIPGNNRHRRTGTLRAGWRRCARPRMFQPRPTLRKPPRPRCGGATRARRHRAQPLGCRAWLLPRAVAGGRSSARHGWRCPRLQQWTVRLHACGARRNWAVDARDDQCDAQPKDETCRNDCHLDVACQASTTASVRRTHRAPANVFPERLAQVAQRNGMPPRPPMAPIMPFMLRIRPFMPPPASLPIIFSIC